ncbi:thymidylate kinase [Microbacterium phage Stromboli]|uniref:thymidylate kinase n=1 Tax=Microbacterium Phage DirtyBubble TaxID=2590932 RepID=UPI001189BEE2|nr:thymidylate kinase [Microbacterium Phage DirtyBubble]YP_010752698.1 thymidylate kinase [Microbacterium phage Stromboli]QDP45051.1 thymidylate kinase [Microbacterium Phage DirtyBubble]QIN93693.1 thymidylate kinase [Microbacterium phage Stromboli]
MIPTVYLIEGADGTGKTSFVSRAVTHAAMADYPEPRVIHNDASDHRLPGSLYRHYRAQLLDAVEFRDVHGLSTYIDRSFLSELVYGPIYRGRSRITRRQARRLERLADRLGVVLLGMTADLDVRRLRIRARGETWTPKDAFVGAEYSQQFRESGRWVIADSTSAHVSN